MNLRKSERLSTEISGNVNKYEAYREAWSRIKSAQENHFFLEAIAIQESIISDRLIRLLSHPAISNPLTIGNGGRYPSFSRLIDRWRKEFPAGVQSGLYQDLIAAVDKWRLARNEIVHAIVKSEPGESTQPIDLFLEKAQTAAKEGANLAREVCKWSQRIKTDFPSE